MSLSDIYQQVILDHYKRPRNKGTLERPVIQRHLHNPSCGDRIGVQVDVSGDRVEQVKFNGQGCSISQASASMMTEAVRGKTLDQVKEFIGRFKAMMRGEPGSYRELGELQSLQGVSKFPVRVKCATIAWTALEEGIQQYERGEAATVDVAEQKE